MPELIIRLKKQSDGSAALACIRADGSSTWQRQTGAQGRFFPRHDLTRYAVETVLGHRRGFYGLVAEGWDAVPPRETLELHFDRLPPEGVHRVHPHRPPRRHEARERGDTQE
jgi:hypothetical protein